MLFDNLDKRVESYHIVGNVTFTPFLALLIQAHHCPCTGTAKNFLYNMDSKGYFLIQLG